MSKLKKSSARTMRTFSITVPAELKPVIKELAQANARSTSSYLRWLILRDTAQKNLRTR